MGSSFMNVFDNHLDNCLILPFWHTKSCVICHYHLIIQNRKCRRDPSVKLRINIQFSVNRKYPRECWWIPNPLVTTIEQRINKEGKTLLDQVLQLSRSWNYFICTPSRTSFCLRGCAGVCTVRTRACVRPYAISVRGEASHNAHTHAHSYR